MPFFLRFQSVNSTAAITITTRAATPIPIPAFVPPDNPPLFPLFWFWVSPDTTDVAEGLDEEVVADAEEVGTEAEVEAEAEVDDEVDDEMDDEADEEVDEEVDEDAVVEVVEVVDEVVDEDVDEDAVVEVVVVVVVAVEMCAGTAFLLTIFTPSLLSQHVTLFKPQQKLPS